MSKGVAEEDPPRTVKRQKFQESAKKVTSQISSLTDLRHQLAFQQDDGRLQRQGIRLFKTFLEEILYGDDKNIVARNKAILNDYLQSQLRRDDDPDDDKGLRDLMQAWSFAAQTNNDLFQSAVSSIIAPLLKTISSLIDFRDIGLRLCKTLLRPAQLKLISRALAAPKQKEHVISPCLRLLTEVVSFDAGSIAKHVYTARLFTLNPKDLSRNLALWRPEPEDKEEARRKPSLRYTTIRYVLANFTFQASYAKAEILKYGNVMRSLFEHVMRDSAEVQKETLKTIRTNILADAAVPLLNKGFLLNEHNLSCITSMYKQGLPVDDPDSETAQTVSVAKDFLHYVCSDSSAGLLRPSSGWYPQGSIKNGAQAESDTDILYYTDLELNSSNWTDHFHKNIRIRNTTLAQFAQTLRPFSYSRDHDLLLFIFQNAPELVADYFLKKQGFPFDPKLTSTWIGYATFLFSVVKLSVPQYLTSRAGYHNIPPPISIVLHNILPQPLTQSVLIRCLQQSSELITLFTVRLLVAAFEKLRRVLELFGDASGANPQVWEEARTRLLNDFISHCPKMSVVIGAFRRVPVKNLLQREATLRLLLLYYEVTPQLAVAEKFDVAAELATALEQSNRAVGPVPSQGDGVEQVEYLNLRLLTLSHLLQISRWASEVSWWHKPSGARLSTFGALLKVVASASPGRLPADLLDLLASIMHEHELLQLTNTQPVVMAFINSLTAGEHWRPAEALYEFIDDVCARIARKPIKYLDERDAIARNKHEAKSTSLLLLGLVEQWPFVAKTDAGNNIAVWLAKVLTVFESMAESANVLRKIRERMIASCTTTRQHDSFEAVKWSDKHAHSKLAEERSMSTSTATLEGDVVGAQGRTQIAMLHDLRFAPNFATAIDASAMHQLSSLPSSEAITSRYLPLTVLLLSAPDDSVRRLAVSTLATLQQKLRGPLLQNVRQDESTLGMGKPDATGTTKPGLDNSVAHTDEPQFYLLLGILLASAMPYITSQTPVPYFCTTYVAITSVILSNPLHPLYDRICHFHTRAPKLDIERLPSWWAHHLLYIPPDIDGHVASKETHLQGETIYDGSSATFPGILQLLETAYNQSNDEAKALPQTTIPESSNPSMAGIHFLLAYIYTSLRTLPDLEILRKRGTLEPILALASGSTKIPRGCAELILAIVWRCTYIEGGSTMLMTRKGIIAWLSVKISESEVSAKSETKDGAHQFRKHLAGEQNDDAAAAGRDAAWAQLATVEGLRSLVQRLWDTCDQERVSLWSGGMMEEIITNLGGVHPI